MKPLMNDPEMLARRLHRFLPMTAYGRPPLLEMLKRRALDITASSRLIVTNVYHADGRVMCQIDLNRPEAGSPILVIPIALLAFDRGHSISREVAEFRRQRRARH